MQLFCLPELPMASVYNSPYNEERLATSVQLLGIPKCSAVCKFGDLKFRVLRFLDLKKINKLKPLLHEYNCVR
jgi:hypothetical protein